MPDDYDLPIDETAARLEHIERRLDLMGQRIAFLEGSLGQRLAFLEGAVFGTEKRAGASSTKWMSPDAYTRSTKRFIWICRVMMAVQVLTVILLQFFI